MAKVKPKLLNTEMAALFNNQEPVKVSPIIRGSRWFFLVAGILYGASKHKFFAEREVGIREEEEKQRAIREAAIKEERELQSQRDIEMLTEMFLGPQASTDDTK